MTVFQDQTGQWYRGPDHDVGPTDQDVRLLDRGIVRSPAGDFMRVPITSLQHWSDPEPPRVAAQAPALEQDPEEGVRFSDYAKSIMAGGAQVAEGVGWLTRMAGFEDVGRSVEELGANAVDYWNSGLSDAAKDALSRDFVRKNEGGEWEWGDANLHTVGLFGAQSLLGTGAGMGAGAGITKVLQVFANPVGRAALTQAVAKGTTALPAAAAGDIAAQAAVKTAASAAKKLQLIDKVLGASGFGLGEGAIGGMTAGLDVYKSVMTLPPEKLAANDRYQQVFNSTDEAMPYLERHQYAAETVAREASSLTGFQAGLTTALLGAPMGAFFGGILGKKALGAMASTTPRAMLTGAGGEAAQEFAQGGAEQLIANRQRAIAGEDIELFEGVLNQAIGGAVAGAPLGGAFGSLDVQRTPKREGAGTPKRDASGKPAPNLDPLRTVAMDAAKAGVPQAEILETVERVKRGEEAVLVAVGKLRKRQMGVAQEQAAAAQQSTKVAIDSAAQEAATSPANELPEPTPAQIEAGNFKKGKVTLQGLDISIENPMGSIRKSHPDAPVQWKRMTRGGHYGYVKGTTDATGEQVDVFVGPKADAQTVFVIDQLTPDGAAYDEPKAMVGYPNALTARRAYHANYPKDWKGLGAMTPMAMADFKQWVRSPAAKQPVAWKPPVVEAAPFVAPATAPAPTVATAAAMPKVLYETVPSKSTRVGARISSLPIERRQEFARRTAAAIDHEKLAQLVGLPQGSKAEAGRGMWQGQPNPGLIETVAGEAGREQIERIAHAISYVHRQDSVLWYRPDTAERDQQRQRVETGTHSPAAYIELGRDLTEPEQRAFDDAFGAAFGDLSYTAAGRQVITIDFSGAGTAAWKARLDVFLESSRQRALPVKLDASAVFFAETGDVTHDWSEDDAGGRGSAEALQAAAGGSPAAQQSLLSFRAEARRIEEEFAGPEEEAVAPAAQSEPSPAAAVDRPLLSRAAQPPPRASPSGQRAAAVRAKLAPAIAELAPLVKVTIAESPTEYGLSADDPLKTFSIEGAFIPGTGVVLFASNLPPGREYEVFTHEVFGHLAMERHPAGREAVEAVLALHDRGHESIEKLWGEVEVRWGHLSSIDHAKEVIALMAERGNKHALMTRLIAGVRRFLRKLGIVRDYSEAEIRDLIARSARALRLDVNKALAGKSSKLAALNPASTDADILAALDEAIQPDVIELDAYLSRAFHGTPHMVNQFSLQKIGSGEGAQTYGWGLYFAENERVASGYQKSVSEKEFIRKVRDIYDDFSPDDAATALSEDTSLVAHERELLRTLQNDGWLGFDYPHQAVQAILREPTSFDVSEATKEALAKFGNLYTVDIQDEAVAKMLDFDEPLSSQPAIVAKLQMDRSISDLLRTEWAMASNGEGTPQQMLETFTGEDVYRTLSGQGSTLAPMETLDQAFGPDVSRQEAASRRLNTIDIPGIKYLDAGSRGKATDRTRNFVLFDDSLVKITARNNQPLFSRAAVADPSIQAIMDRVLAKAPEEFTLKDKVRNIWSGIANTQGLAVKQGLIDSFASIEALERDFTGGALLDASQSAYKAMLATKNLPSVMAAVMMHGVPEFKGGAYVPAPGRKGVIDIFKPLTEHKDGNLLRQWELFAAANRANRLINERNPDGTRREKLFTQDEIDTALTLEQKYPEFRTVLNEWNAFNKQLLDMAEAAGVVDPIARATWEKNDYVPFYRAVDEFQGPRNKKGVAGQSAGIRTLKGRDEALGNVFENMMMNAAHLVDASFKNRAMQRVVGLGIGTALQPVPFEAEAIKVTDDQLARALTKAGLIVGNPVTGLGGLPVVQGMTAAQKAHWSTIFRRVAPSGDNIVTVMVNGKPEYYEVTDPLVLAAITGMGQQNFTDVLGLFKGSKKLLTSAVTAHPAFMLANFVRDTLSTWAVAAAPMSHFVDAIKGLKATLANDPVLLQMMMAGAGGGGYYDSNPEDIRKLIAKKIPTGAARGVLDAVIDSPTKAWEAWRKVGASAENANRVAIFRQVLAAGGTVAEAAYQARDVLNFSMSGSHAAVQWLIQTVPFMNARIQGLYRLYRGARDNKAGFAIRGFMIMAATLALALKNNDEPEYEERKEWEKDLYWWFFVDAGGGKKQPIAIPKPFEVGVLFATLPERLWRTASGRDSGKILWERIGAMFADTFALDPRPQLIKPIWEQSANRVSFLDSPIVGMAEQNLQPEAQFTPWTSETMRELAQAMPDWAPQWLRSPARLEAALKAYTGSLGALVVDGADAIVRESLGYPESPGRKIYDYPVVSRFLKDPNPRTTKYADQMYEMLDEANATYSTINRFRREKRFEEAMAMQRESRSKLAVRVKLNRIGTQVRNLNAQIRLVQLNRTMKAQEKRERIDVLVARKNRITRDVAKFADVF